MDDIKSSSSSLEPCVDSQNEYKEIFLEKFIPVMRKKFGPFDLNHQSDLDTSDVEDVDYVLEDDDGHRYICFICECIFPEDEFEQFQTHVTRHCYNCFKCFHCGAYFDNITQFEQHLQTVPENIHLLEQSIQYIQRWAAIYCMLIKQNSLRRKDLFQDCHAFCKVCRSLDIDQLLPKKPRPQQMLNNYDMLKHLCHHMGYFRFVCLLCVDRLTEQSNDNDVNPLSIDQLIDISITQPHSYMIKEHLLKYHCTDFFAYDNEQSIFQRYMFVGFIERNIVHANKDAGFDFKKERDLYKKSDIDELLRNTPLEEPTEEYVLDDRVFENFLSFGKSTNLSSLDEKTRVKLNELQTEVESIMNNKQTQIDDADEDVICLNGNIDSEQQLAKKSNKFSKLKNFKICNNGKNHSVQEISDTNSTKRLYRNKCRKCCEQSKQLHFEIDNSSDIPQSSNRLNVKVSTLKNGQRIVKRCKVNSDKLCSNHRTLLFSGDPKKSLTTTIEPHMPQRFYENGPLILEQWARHNHLDREEDLAHYFDSLLNSFALTDHSYFYAHSFARATKRKPEEDSNVQLYQEVETAVDEDEEEDDERDDENFVYDDEVQRSPVRISTFKRLKLDAKINGDSLDYDSVEEIMSPKLYQRFKSNHDTNGHSNKVHTNEYKNGTTDYNNTKTKSTNGNKRKRKHSTIDDANSDLINGKSKSKRHKCSTNSTVTNGDDRQMNGLKTSKSKMLIIDKTLRNRLNVTNDDSDTKRKRSKKSKKHKRKKCERDEEDVDSRLLRKLKKKRKKEKKEQRDKEKYRKCTKKSSSPDGNNVNNRYYRNTYTNGDLTTIIEPIKTRSKKDRSNVESGTLFDTSNSDTSEQTGYCNGINVKLVTDMLQKQPPKCSKNDDDDEHVDQELMEFGTKLTNCLKNWNRSTATAATNTLNNNNRRNGHSKSSIKI